jgi:Disulphide bond corrector protein DsbC
MNMVRLKTVAIGLTGVFAAAASVHGQTTRPMPTFETKTVTPVVHRGATAHLRLKVVLPAGLHVQSDKPRDPAFVATSLTLSKPGYVSIVRTTYPKATDLAQAGLDEPLSVFSGTFDIDVEVAISPSVHPGPLEIPGQLRYQSCTAQVCFPPSRASISWRVNVSPAAAP